MKKCSFRGLAMALASGLFLAGAAAPAVRAGPVCDHPEVCEWDLECFYVGPEGNVVWSCRLIKRCYC